MVTAGQGFMHWHVLDELLVRLGTKDELIIAIEQESLMLFFLETFFFSTVKVVVSVL